MANDDRCSHSVIDKSLRDVISLQIALAEELAGMSIPSAELTKSQRELLFEVMLVYLQNEATRLHDEAQNGSRLALDTLLSMATVSCRSLQDLSLSDPTIVQPVAELCPLWPVMTANQTVVKDATQALLRKIKLGARNASPLDLDKLLDRITLARHVIGVVVSLIEQIRERIVAQSQLKRDAGAKSSESTKLLCDLLRCPLPDAPQEVFDEYFKELALDAEMYGRLQDVFQVEEPLKNPKTLEDLIEGCKQLPELTKDKQVVRNWMVLIRQFIISVYDGYPEKSCLRDLGFHKAKHTETSAIGSDTSESNIRDGIFGALHQTLRNMASSRS